MITDLSTNGLTINMPKIIYRRQIDLYCDGGLLTTNPSDVGGMWAWCQIERGLGSDEHIVESNSGILLCGQVQPGQVTNNITELLAAVEGLESMPDGWVGTIYTDSQTTYLRVRKSGKKQSKLNGVGQSLRARLMEQKRRLGNYHAMMVGGHPTLGDLNVGYNERGVTVSRHNCWCDAECERLCHEYWLRTRRAEREHKITLSLS